MNSKKINYLLIILIAIFVGVIGYEIYFFRKQQITPKKQQITKLSSPLKIDTTKWKVYKDKYKKFSFKYSPEWELIPFEKKDRRGIKINLKDNSNSEISILFFEKYPQKQSLEEWISWYFGKGKAVIVATKTENKIKKVEIIEKIPSSSKQTLGYLLSDGKSILLLLATTDFSKLKQIYSVFDNIATSLRFI